MAYEIRLHIDENTPEGKAIERVVLAQHVSPDEAIRRVLRETSKPTPAEQLLGAFSNPEDAALMDEVMEHARRQRTIDAKRDVRS